MSSASGLRGGVAEARSFLRDATTLGPWLAKRDSYREMVRLLDGHKKKAGKLSALDNGLAVIAEAARSREHSSSSSGEISSSSSSSSLHLEHDDLVNIYLWKDTRGKARPNFSKVCSNRADSVKSRTAKAFQIAKKVDIAKKNDPHWEQCMDELNNLIGVGEATSSAIMHVIYPDKFPFMADEVIEAVVPEQKRDYTRAIYRLLRERLLEKCSALNVLVRSTARAATVDSKSSGSSSNSIREFTVSDVGNCIWAVAVEGLLGIHEAVMASADAADTVAVDAGGASASNNSNSAGGKDINSPSAKPSTGSKRKR